MPNSSLHQIQPKRADKNRDEMDLSDSNRYDHDTRALLKRLSSHGWHVARILSTSSAHSAVNIRVSRADRPNSHNNKYNNDIVNMDRVCYMLQRYIGNVENMST